jgi:hypothetical protein
LGGHVSITVNGATRRVDVGKVKTFLTTGRWPKLPKRRNAVGARTPAASKIVDSKIIQAMRERPGAGVRELAQALKMAHPSVSRRIVKLKMLGVVDHDEQGWVIEAPHRPTTVWIKPLAAGASPYLPPPLAERDKESLPKVFQRYG